MLDNQIKGLIAVSILLLVIPFIFFLFRFFSSDKLPILINQSDRELTIEIQDKDTGGGIYFAPPAITADQLLRSIGVSVMTQKDFPLRNGMRLKVDNNSPRRISLTVIDNPRKLALGMPLDLNSVTEEDLLLIPGIGDVTAKKILERRGRKIRFYKIEELKEIKGIKDKKLTKLKSYFYINIVN
jgi:hypothetical protein